MDGILNWLSCWELFIERWIRFTHKEFDSDQFQLFITTCWFLWYHRNKVLAEREFMQSDKIIHAARSYTSAFRESFTPPPRILLEAGDNRWVPPTQDIIKVNFDAALFHNNGGSGAGIIGRNSGGECLAWSTCFFPFNGTPEHIEALAALEAVRFSLRRGWRRIQVEGDCFCVINKLRSSDEDFSNIGTVIHDIKSLVSSFSLISFSFVTHYGNNVTHCLARGALVNQESELDLPPLALSEFVLDISRLS